MNEHAVEIPLVNKAFTFAFAAHKAIGQKRKYTGEDYIVHPVEVCTIVSGVSHTKEMLAAALLHDVVEDTDVTIKDIEIMFGPVVMNHVSWLTKISKSDDGNRATRKAIDRAHTALAPAQAQTIKLADVIANTRDISQADDSFAKVFMAEKKLLLEVLTKGEPILMKRAKEIMENWERGY